MAHSCIFHALSVELNIFPTLRLGVPVCLAEYENYHILTSTVDNVKHSLHT